MNGWRSAHGRWLVLLVLLVGLVGAHHVVGRATPTAPSPVAVSSSSPAPPQWAVGSDACSSCAGTPVVAEGSLFHVCVAVVLALALAALARRPRPLVELRPTRRHRERRRRLPEVTRAPRVALRLAGLGLLRL
ncbi:DUF6153 family protein [Actinoalloteichus caeruleus]|uniref:DUF6153 family protein n=1 Tax=Actinoalloteichus cyanogriseus TaxID=2893586 RepID=UPI0004AA7739|nr:DUF6153 family protein [Actinoalloteichus caeruleus]